VDELGQRGGFRRDVGTEAGLGYEIDFLHSGDESKSGQAVALRFGNLYGGRNEQVVMIVDGGFLENGDALVEHVKEHYGTDRVDVVVSTHPDNDHIKGLEKVLLGLQVDVLWMHQAWLHSVGPGLLFESESQVSAKIVEKIAKNLEAQQTLEVVAASRGIPIVEPFGPCQYFNEQIVILGPSQAFYEQLLAEEAQETDAKALARTLIESLTGPVVKAAEAIASWVDESLDVETLTDGGVTSEMNETGVILELRHDGHRVLLTADAGQRALNEAADAIDTYGLATKHYDLVQIPHHGSRRNVGPSVLNRLLGATGSNAAYSWAACACSSTKGDPKHPSKRVTNAFTRRGARTNVTRADSIRFPHNAPPRPGWERVPPTEPLHLKVEDD
jgi:beta-lactamase superfamily II metal-dependent hydrolase